MKKIIILSILTISLSGCTKIQAPTHININNVPEVLNTNTNNAPTDNSQNTSSGDQVVCTMDAKQCPDGSYVSRVAPDCNFAPCPASIIKNNAVKPIAEFDERITKKPFGIYITPKDSPVQPEKFTGYHTGVDVEYGDMPDTDIPVYAIADGQVVRSGWVSGYGGMVAIRHNINDKNYIVIYGHLNPDTLPKNGATVTAGEQIGILGKGYSHQTDGERKHLHFAIYTGTDINVAGYVSSQKELSKWLDPIKFFQ